MDRSEIAAILAAGGLRPQHKFGQNFMVDQRLLRAIADAGEIGAHDVILEVGPGVGNLTRLLAARAAAVLAVDIDRKLLPAARVHHAALTNVTWLLADVLAGKHQINPDVLAAVRNLRTQHPAGQLKLVSNLPYNAACPLISELLVMMAGELRGPAAPLLFSRLAFTVQYEVAQRMASAPGTGDYGPLGILIQLAADVEILRKIPPGAFWPPPKIHSALVLVRPDRARLAAIPDILALQALLAGLFAHRRQTVHNALRHYLQDRYTPTLRGQIEQAGIDTTLRPEALPRDAFILLSQLTRNSKLISKLET